MMVEMKQPRPHSTISNTETTIEAAIITPPFPFTSGSTTTAELVFCCGTLVACPPLPDIVAPTLQLLGVGNNETVTGSVGSGYAPVSVYECVGLALGL